MWLQDHGRSAPKITKALRLVPPRSIDQRNPERKGPESINSRQSFNIFHTLTITDVPHNEWNNYKRCMQGWFPSSFSFSDKPCNASGEWFCLETGEQWPVKSSQALRCAFSASAAIRSWQDPLTCPPNASSESCRPHLQHLGHDMWSHDMWSLPNLPRCNCIPPWCTQHTDELPTFLSKVHHGHQAGAHDLSGKSILVLGNVHRKHGKLMGGTGWGCES